MIRICQPSDKERIYFIINEAAKAYDGVIPPYLLFQRWMVAGETPCSRAALTTSIPDSTSSRMRNICAPLALPFEGKRQAGCG